LTTINGVSIEVLGTAEFEVENVGPVRFQVLKGIRHDAIVGWDQLHRHGWTMSDCGTTQVMLWGSRPFEIMGETQGSEAAVVTDAGCLETQSY
jgi:hypothetical protein